MKTGRVLSEDALLWRISRLRAMLKAAPPGVSFMNMAGFYGFVENFASPRAVRRHLRAVEPYIPLRVSPRALNGLLSAASGGVEEAKRFERRLAASSTLQFLRAALTAGNDEQWREMVEICRLIRNYKAAVNG